MIDALIQGRLIHSREEGGLLVGRILIENDRPVQFTARRGSVKRAIAALPSGMPISVSGSLCTGIKHDKEGHPYVHHEIAISAVLTAQPTGLLGSLF